MLRTERFKTFAKQKIITPTKFPFIANEFSGKRALVTGGTAGIGKAVVSRLLDGGAKVITTARRKQAMIKIVNMNLFKQT